ncbi:MAG: hypothetical protein JXA71_12875 [Chitinispirillaceae bacterium]|nr:hypothetical protein [Chitinispirillaceae bacterium]
MSQNKVLVYASITALAVSAVFGFGMRSRSADFNRTVTAALNASVNYDNEFINMVNRLEQELASRASFGYEGGKDPMTGLVRQVVAAPQPTPTIAAAKKADTSNTAATAAPLPEPADSIRLTAIIYEADLKNYTAVVMSGERSFSVNVGDRVADRIIRSISDMAIVMDTDSLSYRYDVAGKRSVSPRKKQPAPAKE